MDELELEPWVSLWSNQFGEDSTPPLAWRSKGAEKFTAVEDFTRYSEKAAQGAAAAAAGKERGTRRTAAAGKEGNKE